MKHIYYHHRFNIRCVNAMTVSEITNWRFQYGHFNKYSTSFCTPVLVFLNLFALRDIA